MGRKKKVKTEERTCATCACGPIGDVADCADCTDHDQWAPIEPECDGDSCKISFNGGPEVPFPSKEALGEMAKFVEGHTPEDPALPIIKKGLGLDDVAPRSTQLDLEGKPAEYPVGVEAEEYTVLTFECGSWTLKVREDRLERAAEDDNILGLVQRRLKASGDLYPLSEGEFDRWVQRFTRSLTNYVRTGCA